MPNACAMSLRHLAGLYVSLYFFILDETQDVFKHPDSKKHLSVRCSCILYDIRMKPQVEPWHVCFYVCSVRAEMLEVSLSVSCPVYSKVSELGVCGEFGGVVCDATDHNRDTEYY